MSAERAISGRLSEPDISKHKIIRIDEWRSKRIVTRPGRTTIHETKHTVVAEKHGTAVRMTTIIPGPDYNGLTELSGPDDTAAAAAYGMPGIDFDFASIRRRGGNPHAQANAALSILNESQEEVEQVAIDLQEKKTLFRPEILQAMRRGEKKREAKRKGEKVVTLTTENHEGKQDTFNAKLSGVTVLTHGQFVDISELRKMEQDIDEDIAA